MLVNGISDQALCIPKKTLQKIILLLRRPLVATQALRFLFCDLVAAVEDLRETQNRRPRFRAFPLQFPAHGLAEGGSNVRSPAPERPT